eukprot:2583073-Prymnesium_polylepis.3
MRCACAAPSPSLRAPDCALRAHDCALRAHDCALGARVPCSTLRLAPQVDDLRAIIKTNWSDSMIAKVEQARKVVPEMAVSVKVLQSELKAMEKEACVELAELRKIVYPPKPMERGAFDPSARRAPSNPNSFYAVTCSVARPRPTSTGE